jgi:hypothetical protein
MVLQPQESRAQATNCKEFYFDGLIPREQRSRILIENGKACVHDGRLLQSIALFSELIGLDSQNSTAYFNRGMPTCRSGNLIGELPI